ncbi:MAG: DNA polymerase III subunit delta [bacterium]
MPKIDITALERELAQGRICPVYAIVGEESYLAQNALGFIKDAVAAHGGNDMSAVTFSARDASAENIVNALRTIPLLGGRPLVILRDGGELAKEGRKALMETLTAYLESPVDSATLVLVAEKLDGRTRLAALATKQGSFVECKPLFDDKLPSWIGIEVRRRNCQMSHEAARFLADLIGNDLGQIVQAIERVILYAGGRKVLELKDVEEAVADTHQRDIFDLTNAVGERKLSRALSYLHNLLENGQPPPLILHMLARHFRLLAKAKEIAGRVSERGEVASYLGVNPYYASDYLEQARNFSKGELRESFRALYRCDREIKSSRLPRERILERAIISITQK